MSAQLLGTSGIAALLLLSVAIGYPAIVDVALALALLAAFASIAFVTSSGRSDSKVEQAKQMEMSIARDVFTILMVTAGAFFPRRHDRGCFSLSRIR